MAEATYLMAALAVLALSVAVLIRYFTVTSAIIRACKALESRGRMPQAYSPSHAKAEQETENWLERM